MTGIAPRLGYPNATTAPAVSPAFSTWDSTGVAVRRILTYAQGDAFAGNITFTKPLAAIHTALAVQYVGAAIPSNVNMAGTFTANQQGSTTGAGPHHARMVIKVVSGDGATLRGVLADVTSASAISGTSIQNSVFSGSLASINALAGDRIVVEIGASFDNATAGGTATFRSGDGPNNYIDLSLNAYGPSLLAGEGIDVISTTTPAARLANTGLETIRSDTPAANLASIGIEVLSPVGYVVSAADGVTAIEQLHTDGIWRRLLINAIA